MVPLLLAMAGRYRWLEAIESQSLTLAEGDHHTSSDVEEVVFIERGLTVVRALDESDSDAFAQVRAAPATIGLERLDASQRIYEIHALTDAALRVTSTDELQRLVHRADPAHQSLIQSMSHVLGSCVEDRVAMSGSTTIRVARLLLSGKDGGPRFSRLPRQLWAEVLGMRPETMSRTLRQLDDEGLIEADPTQVVIKDRHGLERLVGGQDED